MRRLSLSLWLALGVAIAVPPLAAVQRTAVFGNDGEVFKVRSGTYGELFPSGQLLPADVPVLALDQGRPGKRPVRTLVPGTEGAELDLEPTLLFEEASSHLYLGWVAQEQGVAQVNVQLYDGQRWSQPIEVAGAPAPLKGRPQFAITRKSYQPPGATSPRTVTLIHLLWWERSQAEETAYYSPIVLEDGVYVGWSSVFRLNDLDRGYQGPNPDEDRALFQSPAIDPGRDSSSFVVGFAGANTNRLLSLEFVVLPLELAQLADQVRAHIIGAGSEDLGALADSVRAHIIGAGDLGHPSLLVYVAESAAAAVRASGGSMSTEQLAGEVRAHIIGAGAESYLAPRLGAGAGAAGLRLVELGASPGSGLPSNLIAFRAVRTRELPDVGPGPVDLQLAPDGENALVTWRRDGLLYYRETTPDGWTEILQPTLPRLLGEDPERLLADRLRQH